MKLVVSGVNPGGNRDGDFNVRRENLQAKKQPKLLIFVLRKSRGQKGLPTLREKKHVGLLSGRLLRAWSVPAV